MAGDAWESTVELRLAPWRGYNGHRPVTLGTAAIASGKSRRVLQRAAKLGLLRARWVHGQWWTTLMDLKDYLDVYARNRWRG